MDIVTPMLAPMIMASILFIIFMLYGLPILTAAFVLYKIYRAFLYERLVNVPKIIKIPLLILYWMVGIILSFAFFWTLYKPWLPSGNIFFS